jgi:hypothetical protein
VTLRPGVDREFLAKEVFRLWADMHQNDDNAREDASTFGEA